MLEVDRDALMRLVAEFNDTSLIYFYFKVALGDGQQSGCVYRTDTTIVHILGPLADLFDVTIEVKLTRDGRRKTKNVVLRQPLLVDVRVRQGDNLFDFRAANDYLKGTDKEHSDGGGRHRTNDAEQLAKWIEGDRAAVSDLGYFVFGDFNSETADQDLPPLLDGSGESAVLSPRMKEENGEQISLTESPASVPLTTSWSPKTPHRSPPTPT